MSKDQKRQKSNPLIKTLSEDILPGDNSEDRPSSLSKRIAVQSISTLFLGNNEAYDVPLESNSGLSTGQEAELFGESMRNEPNPGTDPDKLVAVIDSERVGDKDPYVSYTIRTKQKIPNEGEGFWTVKRRFQDFVSLYQAHKEQISSPIIIPPLPSKNNFELKDKFNPAFVERRKLALERFLARLLLHPYLGDHPFTKAFLSQQILLLKHINASSSSIIGTSTAGISSLMEQVSEAVSGLFGKPGPVEERFLKMKEICRVLDVHSTKLEDIFLNLYKAQKSIEEGLGSSRLNYVKLNSMPLMPHGTSEPANSNGKNLRTLLTKVLLITEERAESIRNFAVSLKNEVITPLHEYHKYSVNAKDALKLRDERQSNVEELSSYLNRVKEQQNELRGLSATQEPSQSILNPLKQGAKAVSSYFTEKIDRMKGLDVLTAKQQKIASLDRRINDLEAAQKAAHEASQLADEVIEKEMAHFEQVIQTEMEQFVLPTINRIHRRLMEKSTAQ